MQTAVQGSARKANLSVSGLQQTISAVPQRAPQRSPQPSLQQRQQQQHQQRQQQQQQQQQQQMTQAQLTYAQKVKGRGGAIAMMNGGGQTLPRPPSQSGVQGTVRMNGTNTVIPPSSSAAAVPPPPTAITAQKSATPSALQSGGGIQRQQAPNQQMQQQQRQQQAQQAQAPRNQQQFRMVQTGPLVPASALQNYAYPYNYTNLQRQAMSNYPSHGQSPARTAYNQSYGRGGGSYAKTGRDFFDRRVQSNVNHAVNRYYSYPQSNRQHPSSFGRYQNTNRWAPVMGSPYRQNAGGYPANNNSNANTNNNANTSSYRGGRRSNGPYRGGGPPSGYGSRRGGRGGYSTPYRGGPPSYTASRPGEYPRNGKISGPPFHSGPNRRGGVRAQRGKPSDSQLKNYENAADRDVLCWIYENQGKCRYGQKCQWLHLDRETGQYIPTVYMMNSLDSGSVTKCIPCPPNEKGKEDEKKEEEETVAKEEEEEVDAVDADTLKTKFQSLMEKNIRTRIEEEKTRKERVDQDEEDNKEQTKDSPTANGKKKGKGDESKEEEKDGDGDGDGNREQRTGAKCRQYGSYGTTFDRFNVCWEFNTFVGCRKGAKCKWAHAYLVKESAHPYTGEKLSGMAVRKFRISNNI